MEHATGLFSFLFLSGLLLGDSAVGAGAFAGAAVDAFVLVDGVGDFSGRDGAHRADIGAGTAGNTEFGVDESRHNVNIFNCCCCFPEHEDRH